MRHPSDAIHPINALGDDLQGRILVDRCPFRDGESMIAVRHLDQLVRAVRELRGLPKRLLLLDDEGGHPGAEEFVGAGLRPAGRMQRETEGEDGGGAEFRRRTAGDTGSGAAPARDHRQSGLRDRGPQAPPSHVQGLGAGATFFPATRQGCSTSATLTPCPGSTAASAWRSRASMPPAP